MNSNEKSRQALDIWMSILVLGSLWGLSEVVLNGAIRAAGLPYRAGILAGIGMALMAVAVAAFRKPVMLIGIALVAVLLKQLAVPILHVSVMCKANSCLAVMLEGTALAGAVALAGRNLHRHISIRVGSAALAALTAAGVFYFAGMHVAPCRYLLSFNRPGGLQAFLIAEGLVWAIFSGMLFPIGYWIGTQIRDSILTVERHRQLSYYVTSSLVVALCWLTSALAIAAGF